ncbi:PREDICTED: uncharacterized protein LOC101306042 [Fragaria vesca subsp. vesca]|uniref:uncharacterized protein LOC101306042 n=1 Tax=Fragaria vesca subsp. vesca TaxID=101020 RepID=UPI0002C33A99|nr:PREDICTED: uncharacterized protein LOC101306042 [Fragaria vesca subsp. vesca]
MDCSALELKVISCQDLKAFNFFQKLSVYADVSIFNEDLKKEQQQQEHLQQRQKTPVDRDGDGNPEWNHMMSFDMKAMSALDDQWNHWFIKFDMRNDGAVLGKSLGKVQVRFKELIEEFNGAVRFMSYQVKTSDGKSNGVLDFSYQVVRKNTSNGIPDSVVSEKTNVVDPTDKVQVQPLYPTLEVESLSRDLFYPSLVEVSSPVPKIPIPSPMLNTQFSLPPHHHRHHHHHHHQAFSPFVQPPTMYWHPSEFTNHGCNFCGNPAGLGQVGMVDYKGPWRTNCPGNRSGLLQAPDPETTTNGRCY